MAGGAFSKGEKLKDPYAPQKRAGLNFIRNLMDEGVPELPTQRIAGLTENQQAIQAGVGRQIGDLNANYGTAQSYLTDIIKGEYDPRTSDYYKGLRQESEDLKIAGQTDIRQGANLGGMLQSTPRMAVEAEDKRKRDRNTLTQLGGMYETERGRMGAAANDLSRLDANRIASTGNLQAIADLERQIENQRNEAVYAQAMQTIQFPYQFQTQLAAQLIGASTPYMTGGGQSNWVTDTYGVTKLYAGYLSGGTSMAQSGSGQQQGSSKPMNSGSGNSGGGVKSNEEWY